MLLQHPGETITREELQKKLWPADTFVDFEQGLNNAMKRLRAALDATLRAPTSSKHCHATAIALSGR
jgi:DNA-binding winged helix-turn-helix (wHTH) protein